MSHLTRREFSQQTLGSLLTFSLLETLIGSDVMAAEVKPLTAKWLSELDGLSRDVRGKKIKQVDWQAKVEQLLAKVDLPEMLTFIDFDKLAKSVKFRDRGELSLRARFPQVEGLPTDLIFGHQIFALGKDRSVVPHGHDNMATAFLILKGKFEGKHYDRLEDDRDHMIIKPTIDRAFGPGGISTISDHKDNVHWFKATTDASFIFNIHVMNVDPDSRKRSNRVYIDPNGEKLSGGRIRARKIGSGEAEKLYG
jgi:hypothetical protein